MSDIMFRSWPKAEKETFGNPAPNSLKRKTESAIAEGRSTTADIGPKAVADVVFGSLKVGQLVYFAISAKSDERWPSGVYSISVLEGFSKGADGRIALTLRPIKNLLPRPIPESTLRSILTDCDYFKEGHHRKQLMTMTPEESAQMAEAALL